MAEPIVHEGNISSVAKLMELVRNAFEESDLDIRYATFDLRYEGDELGEMTWMDEGFVFAPRFVENKIAGRG